MEEAKSKKTLLTYSGMKKLQEELNDLQVNKRSEIADKIKEAREQGDLSENAEYDAAKDEQRDIEARIEEINKILKNAEVVLEEDDVPETVNIGCTVSVHDMTYDEDIEYQIVGTTEVKSLENKISNEGPVGQALMGATVGQVVSGSFQLTPNGPATTFEYLVQKIERTNED